MKRRLLMWSVRFALARFGWLADSITTLSRQPTNRLKRAEKRILLANSPNGIVKVQSRERKNNICASNRPKTARYPASTGYVNNLDKS